MQQRKPKLIKQPHGGALLPPMKKGETMNPNGRPKTYINQIAEELKLSFGSAVNKSTVRTLLSTLAYLPNAKLNELVNNEDMPMSIRLFIKALRKDWINSSTDTIKNLINFEIGATEPENPTDLSQIEPQKLFETVKYLIKMFDISMLEEISELINEQLKIKRSENAKVIEG